MTPRVSVILTVYNRTQFLAEAVASVLTQRYGEYELLVVDDSGTAAARSIVAPYQDTRVRYLPNATTLGIAASLACAADVARGEFIAIINDDDVWESELLSVLVPPLEADARRVLATADHWMMDSAGRVDSVQTERWTVGCSRSGLSIGDLEHPVEFAIRGGPAINIASVFRKDAIDWSLVGPAVAGAYDYWIGCLLAATRRPMYYVPNRLARWRVHPKAETQRRAHDKAENLVYIFSRLREFSSLAQYDALLKMRLAEALLLVAQDKLQFDRVDEARRSFWRSFVLSRDPHALARAMATMLPRQLHARLRAATVPFRHRGRAH